jgi:hypothetical protein
MAYLVDVEDVDEFAARVVAGVFGPDPDFGMFATPAPTRSRLLREDQVAELTALFVSTLPRIERVSPPP